MINIGVDLGAYAVKIATLEELKTHEYDLKNEKTYYKNEETRKDYFKWLKSILKSYTGSLHITSARFHFSVAPDNEDISIAVFGAPSQIEKKMKKSVPIEMEQRIRINKGGYDPKEFYSRWTVVEKLGEERYTLFTAVIRKRIVNQLRKIRGLTWDIGTIETNCASIGRLLRYKDAIVVDFGDRKTRVIAYKDGLPVACQDASNGGIDFVEAVYESKIHEFENEEEARELMHEKAAILSNDEDLKMMTSDDETIAISDSVDFLAETVAVDLGRTISEISSRYDIDISKIYYLGGLAHVDHFIGYIQANFEMGIKWWPLLITGEMTESVGSETEMYDYYIAAGASMAQSLEYLEKLDFNGKKSDIDLGSPLQLVLIIVLAGTIALNGAMAFVNTRYSNEISKIENAQVLSASRLNAARGENERLTQENNSLQEQVARTKRLIQDKDTGGSFMGYSASILDFFDNQKKLSQIMHELQEITPDGVTVIKTICDGSRILINGYGNNYSQTMLLVMSLEERYENVVLREMVSTADLETDHGGNADGQEKNREQFFTIELLSN